MLSLSSIYISLYVIYVLNIIACFDINGRDKDDQLRLDKSISSISSPSQTRQARDNHTQIESYDNDIVNESSHELKYDGDRSFLSGALDKGSANLSSTNDDLRRRQLLQGKPSSSRQFYHLHDLYHNRSKQSLRYIQWNTYEVVNGFRNQDLLIIITTTAVNNGQYLRERIIPSSRTWMRLLVNVIVIIEDTVDSRFYLRHCNLIEHQYFTSFKCPHEPLYVLTRNCTDAYYESDGICCKVDEAMQYLVSVRAELFSSLRYVMLADDDTYFRVDQLLNWLSYVDKRVDSNLPIVGNGIPSIKPKDKEELRGVFHIEGCKEILTNGWYQPVLMNRKAISIISNATFDYGIRETCRIFDCSQDLGLGIFFWMHSFYHLYIPGVYTNPNKKGYAALKPDLMIIHAVKYLPEDGCDGRSWSHAMRYNQHMMTGCGRIDNQSPAHDIHRSISMYDVWNWFAINGSAIPIGVNDEDMEIYEWIDANGTTVPLLQQLEGYDTTAHSKKYDLHKKWHPFTLKHCAIRGKIKNG